MISGPCFGAITVVKSFSISNTCHGCFTELSYNLMILLHNVSVTKAILISIFWHDLVVSEFLFSALNTLIVVLNQYLL